jgi:hypothetical protein
MRFSAKCFAIVASLLTCFPLIAQEMWHAQKIDFARFSYVSFPAVRGRLAEHICFAVSSDGEYRILQPDMIGAGLVGIHGKMTDEDLQKFKALIEADEFRSLSGEHVGIIRQESENFMAEIPWTAWNDHGRTQKFQWLNADGAYPFPASVAKVIEWLKGFDPKGGKRFDYADYPDVCPSGGLRYVQPAVAENHQP